MGNLLYFDCESYFDSEYSLKKMTTPAYILDPRFELQLVAVKLNDGPHEIIDGPDFPAYLARLDPAETTTVAFNALFDNSILAWRYNFVPKLMLDAMGLARALRGHELKSVSLKNVADHLELGSKGTALANMMGKRREQIIAEGLWPSFCAYALRDNILCEGITKRLMPEFPPAECAVMDLVLRACVVPQFVCDVELLRGHLDTVQQAKAELLNACSIDKIKLMSSAKFKLALEELGVLVKTKTSPTGREVPQFAKTDPFMEELQEHPNLAVQAMVAARLSERSTLEEKRTERMIEIATCEWPRGQPMMPIPLRYSGAHTHRLSGDWKINMQNLPADRKKNGKSKLRASLKVPDGYAVVVCDLGQIEARLVAWICGADNLLQQFALYDAGDKSSDPYNRLGGAIFGCDVDRKSKDVIQAAMGFVGKTGVLGLGYRMGKAKFHLKVEEQARTFEVDISSIYTEEIGHKAVDAYRKLYSAIPATWRQLDTILAQSWYLGNNMHFGPGALMKVSRGRVIGPTGLELRYADPQLSNVPNRFGHEVDGEPVLVDQLTYRSGNKRIAIHGGSFLENIVQHLARCQVMCAAVRISKRGYNFALQGHDELVFVVKSEQVDEVKELIHSEMIRPPAWAPDLPLTADVGVGDSYGAAK